MPARVAANLRALWSAPFRVLFGFDRRTARSLVPSPCNLLCREQHLHNNSTDLEFKLRHNDTSATSCTLAVTHDARRWRRAAELIRERVVFCGHQGIQQVCSQSKGKCATEARHSTRWTGHARLLRQGSRSVCKRRKLTQSTNTTHVVEQGKRGSLARMESGRGLDQMTLACPILPCFLPMSVHTRSKVHEPMT